MCPNDYRVNKEVLAYAPFLILVISENGRSS